MPSSTDTTSPTTAENDSSDLMAMAREADSAGLTLGTEAETSPSPASNDATAEASAPATSRSPSAPGTVQEATQSDGQPSETPAPPAPKPGSKFSQAKKEADRRDRSWQTLDKEKEEFRTERERLRTEVESLRRQSAAQAAPPSGPARDAHGATAADYEKLATDYEAQGRDDMAEAARNRASTLRPQPPAPGAAPAVDPVQSPEFQREWQRHTQELISADPELANPESTVVRAANTLLADSNYGRFFRAHPDGIRAAVEVARLMRANAQNAETTQQLTAVRAEITAAKQENARLNALLQPRGSLPAGPVAGDKSIEQMSDGEADAFIRRMAAAADRGEIAA